MIGIYYFRLIGMKTLSLKLDHEVYMETEEILSWLKKPRNRYINDALSAYNAIQKRKMLESRLKKESYQVRDESLNVLKEFENFDYGNEEG